MHKQALIKRPDSILLVVDIQGPFLKAVMEPERVLDRSLRLVKAARVLGVPMAATEQYPERMGGTVPEILEASGEIPIFSKLTFSSLRAEGVRDTLEATGRKTVVLCGVETHVCVNQTAHDLLADGYRVVIARDAVSSRFEIDRETALERLRDAGVLVATTEMVLFEWLESAGAPEFKAVHGLLK